MVCKSHIEEIRGNLFNLFIRKDSPWPDLTLGGGYVFYTLIISYWVNIANILYGTTSVQKEQATLGIYIQITYPIINTSRYNLYKTAQFV